MPDIATTFTVRPLSATLGAEITGIDLSQPVDDDTFDELRRVFHDSQIVVFRDQRLSPERQIDVSRRFGDLEIHISTEYLLPNHPEILVLSNRRVDGRHIGLVEAGSDWHSDLSYIARPSLGSLLYAIEVPTNGGDTEWADMYAAYETLPDDVKRRIDGLKGIHTFDRRRNPRVRIPNQHKGNAITYDRSPDDAIHPLVRVHPATGRKALFVSPRFTIAIADMPDEEAQPLLDTLFAHQIRRDFIYHHKWQQGDLLFWDNRCLIHRACGGIRPPEIRHMHRTTVAGDVPF